jgi:hypothetical protein
MMRVASRALSVFCPHCQKRVTLESLRIVGSHPGKSLATCGDILVEPASQLNLELTGNNILIRGRVRGSVTANGLLEVAPTGRVIGDVRAAKIVVRDGGVIQGRCEMTVPVPVPAAAGAGVSDRGEPDPFEPLHEPRPRLNPLPPPPQQIRPIQFD